MGKVSIVITSYNCENFIRHAIESAICQTYPISEIIVVDDGSTDSTPEVIKDYPVRFVSTSHQGTAFARNVGIESTGSDFIAFLDGDDWYLPTKIEESLKIFRQDSRLGLVQSGLFYYHMDGSVDTAYATTKSFRDFLDRCWIHTNSVYRRTVFEDVGMFNPAYKCCEDFEFYVRMMRAGWTVGTYPPPLFVYRKHTTAKSVYLRKQFLEETASIKKLVEEHLKYEDSRTSSGL